MVGSVRESVAGWAASAAGRRRLRDLAFFAGLFVFVAAAYSPSLKHPPRADQWFYLTDAIDHHTFPDLLEHTYSYNRTRKVFAGDSELFRPVLFAVLSAEKAAFGGDQPSAQLVGIFLHGVICVLLLALLRQLAGLREPDPANDLLPYGVVTFFALNPCVMELVIWQHLHGYLLFLALLLGSLLCVFRFATSDGRWSRASLWGGWLLAVVAAFTYEMGQFHAFLTGLFLAAARISTDGVKKAAGLFVLFASVLVLYQGVNAHDLRVHAGKYRNDHPKSMIVEKALSPITVPNSARFGLYTTAQPFFPSVVQIHYDFQRLLILETLWAGHGLRYFAPGLVLSYCTLGTLAFLVFAGLGRMARDRARLPLLAFLLLAGLYGVYAAMGVLGRVNLRCEPNILLSNSYYAYPALLLALLASAAAWEGLGANRSWLPVVRNALAVGLLALAATGVEQVRRTNDLIARESKDFSRPLGAFQKFVREHRGEPGFRFSVDYAASDPIPERYGYRVTHTVFRRWVDDENPAYRVVYRGGKVHILRPGVVLPPLAPPAEIPLATP